MGSRCCKDSDIKLAEEQLHSCLTLFTIDISKPEKSRLAFCRLSDFKYKERLGYGRFAKVYRVVERRTNRSLAMKVIPDKHEIYSMELRLEREDVIMSKLKSRWLVEMFQCYKSGFKQCLLLQYLPGPTLVQLVKTRKLSPQSIKIYAAEMFLGVLAVHSYGYMHRDIKMANFMLDHNGHVKLCDFGSCIRFLPSHIAQKVFPNDEYKKESPPWPVIQARVKLIQEVQYQPHIPHGTSYYCAPEVIRLATRRPSVTTYSYLCDYWSLGVCYYYLMFRKLPFYSDEKVQVPSLILRWEKTLKFPKTATTDETEVDLIQSLLQEESRRLGKCGPHKVTSHPFFGSIQWEALGIVGTNLMHDEVDDASRSGDSTPVSGVWQSLVLSNSLNHISFVEPSATPSVEDNKHDDAVNGLSRLNDKMSFDFLAVDAETCANETKSDSV